MKKIFMFIILGCLTLYGFSINPIDPPAKSGDNVVTITPLSPVSINKFSNLKSVVPVTVEVTIADCPDYDCNVPGPGCTIQICIYTTYDCSGLPIGCTDFDLNHCTFYIDVRAEEGTYLYAHLVCSGCTYGNGCKQSTGTVPSGGGTVYVNTLRLCLY